MPKKLRDEIKGGRKATTHPQTLARGKGLLSRTVRAQRHRRINKKGTAPKKSSPFTMDDMPTVKKPNTKRWM